MKYAGNIHTHLLGGLLFLYYLFSVDPSQLTTGSTDWKDAIVFAVFFTAAAVCLFSSAAYHTMDAHRSQAVDILQVFETLPDTPFRSVLVVMPSTMLGLSS